MDLPVSTDRPLDTNEPNDLLALSWEWIGWLKAWRAKVETEEAPFDPVTSRRINRYFSRFRHEGGFISVAKDYSGMPFDARVDFIYIPTITALSIQNLVLTAIGVRRWPRLTTDTAITAAGRHFLGHGYDGERYMAYIIELMAYGNVLSNYSRQSIPSNRFHTGIIKCYERLTRALIEPAEEFSWGRIDPQWAPYCLKLLNCDDNNWELLQNSPLLESFATDLKPRPPRHEILQRSLLDE
jgi:hypothetical protein